MKAELITIACHLTTRRESKKHGGYLIYDEPEKIEISYDTYYPNVDVRVWINGQWELAAMFSGHGHTQEYHGGEWESYVLKALYPRALEAKAQHERSKREAEEREREAKAKRLNDSATFAN